MNENVNTVQHYGLTERQYYCLCVIQELTAAKGFAPSLTEIGRELEMKGRAPVHALVKGLIERGYLTQIPRRGRSLRVLRPVQLPDFGDAAYGAAPALPHQGGAGKNERAPA